MCTDQESGWSWEWGQPAVWDDALLLKARERELIEYSASQPLGLSFFKETQDKSTLPQTVHGWWVFRPSIIKLSQADPTLPTDCPQILCTTPNPCLPNTGSGISMWSLKTLHLKCYLWGCDVNIWGLVCSSNCPAERNSQGEKKSQYPGLAVEFASY